MKHSRKIVSVAEMKSMIKSQGIQKGKKLAKKRLLYNIGKGLDRN